MLTELGDDNNLNLQGISDLDQAQQLPRVYSGIANQVQAEAGREWWVCLWGGPELWIPIRPRWTAGGAANRQPGPCLPTDMLSDNRLAMEATTQQEQQHKLALTPTTSASGYLYPSIWSWPPFFT